MKCEMLRGSCEIVIHMDVSPKPNSENEHLQLAPTSHRIVNIRLPQDDWQIQMKVVVIKISLKMLIMKSMMVGKKKKKKHVF